MLTRIIKATQDELLEVWHAEHELYHLWWQASLPDCLGWYRHLCPSPWELPLCGVARWGAAPYSGCRVLESIWKALRAMQALQSKIGSSRGIGRVDSVFSMSWLTCYASSWILEFFVPAQTSKLMDASELPDLVRPCFRWESPNWCDQWGQRAIPGHTTPTTKFT